MRRRDLRFAYCPAGATQVIAPLRELQALVLNPDLYHLDPKPEDRFLCRIAAALKSFEDNDGSVGVADIGSLISQAVLRCHCGRGETPEIRVSRRGQWLNASDWQTFGCQARFAGLDHYRIRARSWDAPWLDPGARSVVEDAFGEVERRVSRELPADPAVVEYAMVDNYVNPGQREAVQAAFLMEPGTTVVINLPTGGGKSLAFQLPALAWSADLGLTLVITPTVALARDQESRFYALLEQRFPGHRALGTPLAYHGGLDAAGKNMLRSGIRSGELPIVFASPEAALGSLRDSLFDAAEHGRLRIFAIDEAHIVSQWGQQFRPEFQSLAGLRAALLSICPSSSRFRTLLLTATLTSETLRVLRMLFGTQGCEVVSEATLRPEPGFLLSVAKSESERELRILEAVNRLPHPLLLYATERDHAKRWYEHLLRVGYRRIRLVRGGDLSEPTGERILNEWRSGAVDIIVATSAFGLGVDQAHVRSVIHACLPESLDRFYQEVGRAGRDGRAAVSVLISVPDDRQTAEALAQERLISTQRGFQRWQGMWARVLREPPNDSDCHVLSLDDRPPDLATTSEKNIAWNLRTLVLMAQAGLIEFTAHRPPEILRLSGEDEDSFNERWRQARELFSRQVAITVRDDRLLDQTYWESAVERTRIALRQDDQKSFQRVLKLLNPTCPLNDLLREVYTLEDPPIQPPRLLGSCPVTRRTHQVSFRSLPPELVTIRRTGVVLSESLERALMPCRDQAGRMWISCEAVPADPREARRWREQILLLLRYLVTSGVVELGVPPGLLETKDWMRLLHQSSYKFIISRSNKSYDNDYFTPEIPVPRLTVLSAGNVTDDMVTHTLEINRPTHLILLPHSLIEPGRPNRRILDTVRHLSIDEALARLRT